MLKSLKAESRQEKIARNNFALHEAYYTERFAEI